MTFSYKGLKKCDLTELLLSLVTTGVLRRWKELSLCAIFVYCPGDDLQQASVQSANASAGFKHVYTTLMTYRKFFHYFPIRAVVKGDSESTRSF